MYNRTLFCGLDGELDSHTASVAAGRAYLPPAEEHEQSSLEKAAEEGDQPSEELIDEAVEGTFPASDPPFWMPYGR